MDEGGHRASSLAHAGQSSYHRLHVVSRSRVLGFKAVDPHAQFTQCQGWSPVCGKQALHPLNFIPNPEDITLL